MMNRINRLMALTVVLCALVAAGARAQDDAPRREAFFLSFIPNIQFSPLYIADAKGYFAEAGYLFDIEYGDENIGVELIATGAYRFGMISGEQVLLARAGGRPVVYVYQWFQEYPVGIVVPSTTPADDVQSLRGLRVGVPGRFGANYLALTAMLAANGMTEADIDLQTIGFNAPDIVCAGQVDASVIYANNEPFQIAQRAQRGECGAITGVSVLRLTDYTQLVSNGLVTNERMIADDPDAVRAVVVAFDRALRDAINNPAEAYLISLDYVENLPASPALIAALTDAAQAQADFLASDPTPAQIAQSRADLLEALAEQFDMAELGQLVVLLATIEMWNAEELGFSDEAAWQTTAETIIALGATYDLADLPRAFTNAFLPTED